MNLQETMFIRKTTRQFDPTPLGEDTLRLVEEEISQLHLLDASIPIETEILSRDAIKTLLPWGAPHYVLIHAPDDPDALREVGFRFQQLDLFIQSIGLGSCWLGMAKPVAPSSKLPFIVMIAFGKARYSPYRKPNTFVRRGMEKVSDLDDERLEVARIAPSATNRQPWYFLHDDNKLHAYGREMSFLGKKDTPKYTRIDVGIALSHLYLANPERFTFELLEEPPQLPGHVYIGTITT